MYASTLHPELLAPAAFVLMLAKARAANERRQITGMLLVSNQYCFQVIEGEPDVVDALYSTIALDSRHRDVSLMMRARIVQRGFERWTMGESRADPDELRSATGIKSLLSGGFATASLGLSQARRLINALQKHEHWVRPPLPADSP